MNDTEERNEIRIANQFYKLQDSSETSSSSSTDLPLNPLNGLHNISYSKHSERCMEFHQDLLRLKECLAHIYEKETLLVEVGLAILAAYVIPHFGMYLQPHITAHWIAVVLIFCKFLNYNIKYTSHASLHTLLEKSILNESLLLLTFLDQKSFLD